MYLLSQSHNEIKFAQGQILPKKLPILDEIIILYSLKYLAEREECLHLEYRFSDGLICLFFIVTCQGIS